MFLRPRAESVKKLNQVFTLYAHKTFPSLRQQLDRNFDQRYEEFWESQKEYRQARLWTTLDTKIDPSDIRVEFDLAVCDALGIKLRKDDLLRLYGAIVEEMMITRSLSPD